MSFLRKTSDAGATQGVFPTFLLPSVPFRRKSRQASNDTLSSSASVFSDISASVSSTSSNPFSRCPTPLPPPVHDSEILPPTDRLISGHSSHIHCAKCSTDLCLTSQIISKGFTGRHGKAYLVQGAPVPGQGMHSNASLLPNTYLGKPVPRNLVTGQHTVSDINCAICGTLLGWKYVAASELAQRYKVGKFILETKKTRIGVCWEGEENLVGDNGGYDEVIPLTATQLKRLVDGPMNMGNPTEFDSQDEDECEDLFAGVWSPQLASKRRQRRRERMGKKGAKIPPPRLNWSQDSLT